MKPVVQPMRRIPFNLRKSVDKTLDDLLSQDIIEPVQGPTTWVSAPVFVPKPGTENELRLCVDMRRVSEAILRAKYTMPTIDEILTDMNGATVFSKLDLKWGFHQIELDVNSRHLTTFVTHKGLFRYEWLMFGVSSAPEEYQKIVQQVLRNCEGTNVIADDIIVHGPDVQTHDRRLEKVLATLCDRNFT